MRIEELKPSKRVQGRWLAVLEDGSVLRVGEGEVIDFALYAGKELADGEAQGLVAAARRSGLKEKALDLLTRNPMSRKELERKLQEWEAGEEETASICARMEELGFLNDGEYGAMLVRDLCRRGYGPRRIRQYLREKLLDLPDIEQAMEAYVLQPEKMQAYIETKLRGQTPDRKALKRVADGLFRRGFSWDEIQHALRDYSLNMEDVL